MRLDVTEARERDGVARLSEAYDLVIGAASWDKRCTMMLEDGLTRATLSALITYEDQGKSGRTEDHEQTLRTQFASVGTSQPREIRLDAVDLLSSWRTLRTMIVESYAAVGHPMRVLLDLTSLPRYLSLGLLGFGVASGFTSSLDFYYAGASSYIANPPSHAIEFTSGRWLPWPIVGLGGPSPARARLHLIVSAGFEGAKTRKLVDALEPERISVIFASPGSSAAIEARAMEENSELIETYLVPEDQIVGVPIASVKESVASIMNIAETTRTDTSLESESEHRSPHGAMFPEIPSFLLSGPKSLSLAMAIASLQLEVGDVLYIRPDEHRETSALEVAFTSVTRVAPPWFSHSS